MSDEQEPNIDGVPICEIIEMGESAEAGLGAAYQRASRTSSSEKRKRFTVYAGWNPYQADKDGFIITEWESIEEIDVNAVDDTDSFIIAELALQWHYKPGWKLIATTERWGMYY